MEGPSAEVQRPSKILYRFFRLATWTTVGVHRQAPGGRPERAREQREDGVLDRPLLLQTEGLNLLVHTGAARDTATPVFHFL